MISVLYAIVRVMSEPMSVLLLGDAPCGLLEGAN